MPPAGVPCMVSRTWVLRPMDDLQRLWTRVYTLLGLAAIMRAMESTPTRHIAETLTRAIVEHKLQPGTKLAEQKLADHFGVSRTLVRQALFQLAQNRLVKMEKARGAFVAAPTVEEARQVFQVRRMLETEMTRQFVRAVTPAKVKALREHIAQENAAVESR